MSALSAVADILKDRFPNLTVQETIALSERILVAAKTEQHFEETINAAIREVMLASLCGHGRPHIFCGDCNGIREALAGRGQG